MSRTAQGRTSTLHCSPNVKVDQSTRMRWVRSVACTDEMRNAYKILVRTGEGSDDLGELSTAG
jgi:hypothetical protein